jgi:hypothetical protein
MSSQYTKVIYGMKRNFKSEGDLYEWITGHRSVVIDAAESKMTGRKDGHPPTLTKENPHEQCKTEAQGNPDSRAQAAQGQDPDPAAGSALRDHESGQDR